MSTDKLFKSKFFLMVWQIIFLDLSLATKIILAKGNNQTKIKDTLNNTIRKL